MKRMTCIFLLLALLCTLFTGCGSKKQPEPSPAPEQSAPAEEAAEPAAEETAEAPLPDGEYIAIFTTDSSMFHVNEAYNDEGILTVENGQMTIHVALAGKGILNLFPGSAEDAQAEGAVLLEPTTDTVKYNDGTTEEVYGFDIPVPALDEEFPCALVGKKGTWYDHMVVVSDPQPVEEPVG